MAKMLKNLFLSYGSDTGHLSLIKKGIICML